MTKKHKTKAKTSYNFLYNMLQEQLDVLLPQNQVALGIGIVDESSSSSSSNSNNTSSSLSNVPMTPPMIPTETPIIDSGNGLNDSMVSILPTNLEIVDAISAPIMGDSLQLNLAPVMENDSNEGANGSVIIDDSQNAVQEPVVISDPNQNTDTIIDDSNLDLNGLILPIVNDGAEQDQNTSAGNNSGNVIIDQSQENNDQLDLGNSSENPDNLVIEPVIIEDNLVENNDDQEEGIEMQEIIHDENNDVQDEIVVDDSTNNNSADNSDDNMASIMPIDMGNPVDNSSSDDNSGQTDEIVQEDKKEEDVVLADNSDDNMVSIMPIDMGSPVDNGASNDSSDVVADDSNEVSKEEDKKEEETIAVVSDEVVLDNSGAALEDTKEEPVVVIKPASLPKFPNQLYLYSKGIANPDVKGQELSEADLRSRESEGNTEGLGLVKDRMAFMYSIFGGKVGTIVADNSDLLGSDDNAEE